MILLERAVQFGNLSKSEKIIAEKLCNGQTAKLQGCKNLYQYKVYYTSFS
jgi:hypothetical protein